MHYTTGEILSVCGSHGSMHDFKIFKKSMRKLKFKPFFIVDKGYLGIKKLGFGCLMPSKAKKTEKLDFNKFSFDAGYRVEKVKHAIQDQSFEPYRVCRRVNILRDYPDDKIKIYP